MEKKPYVVIARKYRPQTFDEVVGQDPISKTLKNAIDLGRIGHAYLFTGPRGVGKTSMARIFSKALNCKSGPTTSPCGKCQGCLEIEQGRALDVLEIDGASNRGIDEIRALRENVRFAPAGAPFKIYIIDEVHQITHDAFNALLKTLEEPPPYVKFIFATTSAQKVPATILSRCQRFDFRRIPTDLIVSTLKEICKTEKIQVDDEALYAIAKAADGSLRDSQSILDQIAAAAGEKITKAEVVYSLGALEDERLVELTAALASRDARAALLLLDGVLSEGKDPGLFLEKMLEHIRNLLFLQVSDKLAHLIDAGENYKKLLARQKDILSGEELFYFFGVISQAIQLIRRFEMKRIPIEVALIKLARRVPMTDLAEALARFQSDENKTVVVEAKPRPLAPSLPKAPASHKVKDDAGDDDVPAMVEEIPVSQILAEKPEGEIGVMSVDSVWQTLLSALKTEKISVASYLAEGEPLGLKNGVVTIAFPERFNFHKETLEGLENRRLIEKHLSQLMRQPVRIEFESVKEISGRLETRAESAKPSQEMDSAVKNAMSLFGGKVVER